MVTVTILKMISRELKSCIINVRPSSHHAYLVVVEVEAVLVEEGSE